MLNIFTKIMEWKTYEIEGWGDAQSAPSFSMVCNRTWWNWQILPEIDHVDLQILFWCQAVALVTAERHLMGWFKTFAWSLIKFLSWTMFETTTKLATFKPINMEYCHTLLSNCCNINSKSSYRCPKLQEIDMNFCLITRQCLLSLREGLASPSTISRRGSRFWGLRGRNSARGLGTA